MIMKCHKCEKEISRAEFENDVVMSNEGEVFHSECHNEYEQEYLNEYTGAFNEWLMMSSYKKSNKKKT